VYNRYVAYDANTNSAVPLPVPGYMRPPEHSGMYTAPSAYPPQQQPVAAPAPAPAPLPPATGATRLLGNKAPFAMGEDILGPVIDANSSSSSVL
jgi:hypothetical protein